MARNQHEHEEEDEELGEEPQRAPHPVGPEEGRAGRAAEEERDDDGGHRHRVHELGEEEQGEADRRVLGVEAADQLLLGLDEVERRPVHLGRARDEEDGEGHEAGDDQVPAREDPQKPSPAWVMTMSCVDSEPASSTTATTDIPRAAS